MTTTSDIISLIQGMSELQLEQFKDYILRHLRIGAEGTKPGMTAHSCPHCKGLQRHKNREEERQAAV